MNEEEPEISEKEKLRLAIIIAGFMVIMAIVGFIMIIRMVK